jgi:allantoin racemase
VSIRIWHQSITDLSRLPGYAERLATIGEAVGRDGTTISVHGVAPGSYPEGVAPITALRSPWAHHLLATQVVLGAIRAAEEGFDAVTVSCFFDPGLREAREASGIPIVSACESAILAATSMGARSGLIALDGHQARFLRRLVSEHGLADRVASIVALDPEVTEHDLEGELPDTSLRDRMESAAQRAAADGAGVIVPAEGVLNTRLAAMGVRRLAGLAVLDSFATLVAHAEMLVHIDRAAGSRGLHRARPWRALEASTGSALCDSG